MSTARTLCADHEHAATQCLAKNGHHPDSDTADQLRADLGRACTPGRWCPPLTPTEAAVPGYYTARIVGVDLASYAFKYEYTFHQETPA